MVGVLPDPLPAAMKQAPVHVHAWNEIAAGTLIGAVHVVALSLILIPFWPTATNRVPEKHKAVK
jgi:hypothetical protein